jgi:hypothetical protein
LAEKTRAVPPALRRVVEARDGGCRFPGCERRRFLDAHHLVHCAHGGETGKDNLILLCRHHHRLVHEGGIGSEVAPIGWLPPGSQRRRLLDFLNPAEARPAATARPADVGN